MFSQASV